MKKMIPYEKLSKKEKRRIDQVRRQTWCELNPVTRKPENSKEYNRRKAQDWKRELPPTELRLFMGSKLTDTLLVRNKSITCSLVRRLLAIRLEL